VLDAMSVNARSEKGSVLVIVAVFLPVALILASFAIDLSGWWVHKRHLQSQADAAALAAAQEFTFPCDANTVEPTINSTATAYGGGSYNPQVSGAQAEGRVHLLINSKHFYNQPDLDPDITTAGVNHPCTANGALGNFIDVKMTEENSHGLFQALNIAKFINARARVSIQREGSGTGLRPIGVPDPNPRRARVYFINEDPGAGHAVLAEQELTPSAVPGPTTYWSTMLPVGITAERIGIRLALSGDDSQINCSDQLVVCYDISPTNAKQSPVDDSNANNVGVGFLRGWSADPTLLAANDKPVVRSVALDTSTGSTPCTPSLMTINNASACTVRVKADVEFNAGAGTGTQLDTNTKVEALVQGNTTTLAHVTGSTYAGNVTVDPTKNTGPIDVAIDWHQFNGQVDMGGSVGLAHCSPGGGNKCDGHFGNVQRVYVDDDNRSGPLQSLSVQEGGQDVTSLKRCSASTNPCQHNLTVTFGLKASLALQLDTIQNLRVGSYGSQTQSLDCDPNNTLKTELAVGCTQDYRIFRPGDPACPNSPTQLPVLYGTSWPCVAIETGQKTSQIPAGMNQRILGSQQASSCVGLQQNQYPNWRPHKATDPRIIKVFIVPYGAFQGSGGGTVPVTGSAMFYVTGWTGQGSGFNNPCPIPPDETPTPNDPAFIVGRFIQYTDLSSNGEGSGTPCDGTSIDTCVAVLTK
jgi:Putative Flp pilus-assembly TadE/G-like